MGEAQAISNTEAKIVELEKNLEVVVKDLKARSKYLNPIVLERAQFSLESK